MYVCIYIQLWRNDQHRNSFIVRLTDIAQKHKTRNRGPQRCSHKLYELDRSSMLTASTRARCRKMVYKSPSLGNRELSGSRQSITRQ